MTDPIIPKTTRRSALKIMGVAGAAGLFAPYLLGKPAFAQTPPAAPSGRVIVGLSQEPTVFNPLMLKIEVDDGIHFSVFDALFRTMPDGSIVPNLAIEVPSQENGGLSADGLQWRVKLRDDVKWHDGAPLTAEDVKFTLELIVDPNFRSWRTAGHNLVYDIAVVSPNELTWRMKEPFAPYLSFLTETFIVPKHVLEREADKNAAAFNQAPIGTGAFKWGKRVAGDHINLVANANYHGEGPYIEQLVFKYIPDLTVLYTQFKSGDIDLVGRQYITPDNYAEAKTLKNRVVQLQPAPAVEQIYLNLERPVFKDLAVRQAIYAAIDKQSIIDALYYGLPEPVESYMPRGSIYYNKDLPKHEFSLQKAAKLLDSAGWVKGRDGIRAKDGVRLSFTNSTTTGNHLREQMQQFVQQTLKEIGIEMTISNLPAAVIWGDFWTLSQFDSVVVGINYLVGADPDVFNRFHSGAIRAKGGRGSNTAQYSNPRVDKLLEEGARSFDQARRIEIYREIQDTVRADLPFLPLFSENSVQGWKSDIKGVVSNSNTRSESWHAAGWSRKA
ncbi:ABC transporter substrate-binding protein [Pollutimonas nitritireducens]|uniref:ABC transporter substrate-binding protein n=1 Tax=Pollutimonas nitritireducens TaxID=2045209 RepID=A0A2N4UJR5_9BURK|nr:ABC transporter substrate-binding protein [Pollutimonas nitritireducens]